MFPPAEIFQCTVASCHRCFVTYIDGVSRFKISILGLRGIIQMLTECCSDIRVSVPCESAVIAQFQGLVRSVCFRKGLQESF